jgi:hypothetical protein
MVDGKGEEVVQPEFHLGVLADNVGEPIRLTGVNLCGVSAQAGRGGDKIEIWTRMVLTSSEPLFHKITPGLASAIEAFAQTSGRYVSLARHTTVLLVVRSNDSAELWLDAAAVTVQSRLRRSAQAGSVLFDRDVADISGMWFPLVKIGPTDRIVCLFREGWRFGLFFDFNPEGALDIVKAQRDLGGLLRRMRYADLYAVLAREPTFTALVDAGWFPFLELASGEFRRLVNHLESGFELHEAEEGLLKSFDYERLDRMFERWKGRPHLKAREPLLRSAVNAFKISEPVATIKIVLTEIEGVLAEAHFRDKGERTYQIKKLLAFAVEAAKKRAGGDDTLFFPIPFATYLRDHTYAGFTPGAAKAGSRHAVGHGALPAEQYTMTRALQALLTLDQIAFYT